MIIKLKLPIYRQSMQQKNILYYSIKVYIYIKIECLYKQPKSELTCFSDKQAKQSRVPKRNKAIASTLLEPARYILWLPEDIFIKITPKTSERHQHRAIPFENHTPLWKILEFQPKSICWSFQIHTHFWNCMIQIKTKYTKGKIQHLEWRAFCWNWTEKRQISQNPNGMVQILNSFHSI